MKSSAHDSKRLQKDSNENTKGAQVSECKLGKPCKSHCRIHAYCTILNRIQINLKVTRKTSLPYVHYTFVISQCV